MEDSNKLRIDKYLWAIRIFKTRSLATEACKAGRVKLNGDSIKPAHVVHIGETYSIQKGIERKIIKATGLLENRADAKKAALHYEDLTPPQDVPAYQSVFTVPVLKRPRGSGRPTKRERRDIDKLRGD